MRHAVKDLGKTKLELESFLRIANINVKLKSDLLVLINSQFLLSYNPALLPQFRGPVPFFRTVYPFLPFSPSDLSRVGNHFWNSHDTQKSILQNLFRKFPDRFLRQSDWLSLESSLFIHEKGNGLYRKNNSILPIFKKIFPEFLWEKSWRFPAQASAATRRTYMDGYVAGWYPFVSTFRDLEDIDAKQFRAPPRGDTIVTFYGNSHQLVFKEHYPELDMKVKNDGYWKKTTSVDEFITAHFDVRTRGDFPGLTTSTLVDFPGGSSLLCLNNGNVPAIVSSAYPELAYSEGSSRGYWRKPQNNKEVQRMVSLYEIKSKEDWYRISIEQMSCTHGRKVARKRLMVGMLEYWYPEEEWDYGRFSGRLNRRARQRELGLRIREMWEGEVVFEDYVFKSRDRVYVFDFYIPSMGCIIEYQGEQHYYDMSWFSFEEQRRRDIDKRAICLQNNLTFIGVPYWWDTSLSALKQILQDQAPLKTPPPAPHS